MHALPQPPAQKSPASSGRLRTPAGHSQSQLAAKTEYLINEILRFLFCYEARCLHRVHQDLQFWYRKLALWHIVVSFVILLKCNDLEAKLGQSVDVSINCSDANGDALFAEQTNQLLTRKGTVFVGIFLE